MDLRLEYWDQDDRKRYLVETPGHPESINLPWVIVSISGSVEIVQKSFTDKETALGFMLNQIVFNSYSEWLAEVCERFGLDEEVVEHSIREYLSDT